jgi:integrase
MAARKPGTIKAGVRSPRRAGQTWSFIVDMGKVAAQRCNACNARTWADTGHLDACPKCGGTLRDTTERRHVETSGFPTKQAATEARTAAVGKFHKGSYRPPSKLTLAEFLRDSWLPSLEHEGLKVTTRESYERHVRDHLIGPTTAPFELGTTPLRALTVGQVKKHYSMLSREHPREVLRKGKPVVIECPGLAKASIRRLHAVLHKALNVAVSEHILDHNPSQGAADKLGKVVQLRDREIRFWSEDELHAFLAFAAGGEYYPLWRLLAVTGMRRGEACALKWSAVDLEEKTIAVSLNRVPINGGMVEESTTKTETPRTIQIDDGTVAVLKAHGKAQKELHLRSGKRWTEGGWLFTDHDGAPLPPARVSWQFRVARAAAVAAGIELSPLTAHGLRHTHASIALRKGIPVQTVSAQLGHASVKMTLDIYSHAMKDTKADCAAAIAGAID